MMKNKRKAHLGVSHVNALGQPVDSRSRESGVQMRFSCLSTLELEQWIRILAFRIWQKEVEERIRTIPEALGKNLFFEEEWDLSFCLTSVEEVVEKAFI